MESVTRALCFTVLLMAGVAQAQDRGAFLVPDRGVPAAPAPTPSQPPQASFTIDTYRTQPAGKLQVPYSLETRRGALLVGFRVEFVTNRGQKLIRGLQPIFRTAAGVENGTAMGSFTNPESVIQAKDDYAISSMNVQVGESIEGFDVIFRKTQAPADGSKIPEFTPDGDTYKSEWCGVRGRGVMTSIDTKGHPAIGMYGSFFGGVLTSMGLIGPGTAPPGTLRFSKIRSPFRGPQGAQDPTAPASFPPSLPTTPVPPVEEPNIGAELFQRFRDSLVFVDGENGKGSGFICNIQSHKLLVTNAHVLAGIRAPSFRMLDGSTIKVGQAAVAVDHDVAVLAVPEGLKAIDAMQTVDTTVAVGDRVVVLGNAEGAGVAQPLVGKIVGLGPNLVEVDAEFVPGNSGSPIIHEASGKVIGVATYLIRRKFAEDGSKSVHNEVRRFGYRLDSIKQWEPIVWPSFYAQATQVSHIQDLTADLVHFLEDAASGKFHPEQHQNPVIKPRIESWLQVRNRKGVSAKDAQAADANLLSYLKVACRNDMAQVRRQLTYDYFIRKFDQEQKDRDELAKVFGNVADLMAR